MARRVRRLAFDRMSQFYLNQPNIERAIKNQVKKEKGIIYGARSIQKQIPLFARGTQDYDVFVKNPKRTARRVEKKVESFYPGNDFFVKKGMNPGTYKLKHIGSDGRKETEDDISISDFTRTPRPTPPFKVFHGIRYRALREELKAKKKILADKTFAFRHKKDREDLNRIVLGRRFYNG